MADRKYRRVEDTVYAQVEDDIVALNVRQGRCYGMENVTAAVWSLLAEPISLDGICRQLMDTYDVDADECRSDVGRLLDTMHQEGLVELVS